MLYYVDKEAYEDGDHEVHQENCKILPKPERLVLIGDYRFGFSAMKEARKQFIQANGCRDCMGLYHMEHR